MNGSFPVLHFLRGFAGLWQRLTRIGFPRRNEGDEGMREVLRRNLRLLRPFAGHPESCR
jgi:hypothetical protein